MPILPSNKHALLQSRHQYVRLYLSILPRIIIWRARVNDVSIEKGSTLITFDSGGPIDFLSPLGFNDIEPNQTLLVGTELGDDNIGRCRVREVTSEDGGTTGVVKVAGHSWEIEDNHWLAFIHLYEIFPRFAYIDPETEVFYKDDDIAYEDVDNPNQHPLPIPVVGPNRAQLMQGGSAVFPIDMSESYAVDVGRTITNYQLTVTPNDGVTINLNNSTGIGDIEFTKPGHYWVRFGVTDSNGKTMGTRRWYAVHDKVVNPPISHFQVQNLTGSWDNGGYQLTFDMFGDMEFNNVPDGAPCILWGETYYDDTLDAIGFLPEAYDHILFSGYIQDQALQQDRTLGTNKVSFTAVTPQAILDNTFMYSVPLEVADPVTDWHEYDKHLTVGRAVEFVLRWHSTAIHVMDVIGLLNKIVYRRYFEFTEGSILGMINTISYQAGTREKLICDQIGRMHFVEDLQLRNDEDREDAVVIAELEDLDIGEGPIELVHRDAGTNATLWVSAIAYDGVGVGAEGSEPYFAVAPGYKPAERGSSVANIDQQTVEDQQETNELAGRYWSRDNNPYPELRVPFHGHYFNVLCPWLPEWWFVKFDDPHEMRLPFEWQDPGKKLLCRSVDAAFTYDDRGFTGRIVTNAVFEPEAPSIVGVEYIYPELPEIPPPPPEIIPPPPPPPNPGIGDGFGTVYVMDPVVLWRTRDFSASPPTWTNILNTVTGFKQDFILDPWYPRQVGFCVADTGIWRSNDLDTDSPTFSLVLPTGSIAAATGMSVSQNLLPISGSINVDGFFCFPVVVTQDSPAARRLYIVRTFDRGDTWDLKLVARQPEDYNFIDTIGNTMEVVPHLIGGNLRIFTTIRTLQVAYILRSDDAGETWTQVSTYSSSVIGAPRFTSMSSPYADNEDGETIWLTHTHPSAGSSGLLRGYAVSHNSGISWSKTTGATLAPNPHRKGIESYTQNKNRLVRANGLELYTSNNEGASWELKHTFPSLVLGDRITALGGFPYNGDQFYVCTATKVWVSVDGGSTFEDKTGAMVRDDSSVAGRDIPTSIVVPVWVSEE